MGIVKVLQKAMALTIEDAKSIAPALIRTSSELTITYLMEEIEKGFADRQQVLNYFYYEIIFINDCYLFWFLYLSIFPQECFV